MHKFISLSGVNILIYRVIKEAEANKLKLTPQFLELKFIEAIAHNTKIFFGNKVFMTHLYLSGLWSLHMCASLFNALMSCRYPIWSLIRGCLVTFCKTFPDRFHEKFPWRTTLKKPLMNRYPYMAAFCIHTIMQKIISIYDFVLAHRFLNLVTMG